MSNSSKTIIRVQKNRENPYVMINKGVFTDLRLSWKAKGLMGYLLSKPDDWRIMVADLIKQSTDGRDSVYAGLKELRELGYIEHIEVREKGKIIGHEYLVYEDPQTPQTENPEVAVEPYPEKPDTANPDTKKPDRENPTLLINDLTNQSIRHHTEPNNKETVAAIQKQIESILEQSVSSLTKTLPNWIERFGMDRLIEVAQFIGNTRGKWDNPVGTYRTAITEEWDVSIVTQATEEVAASQDKRYKAFYELFPDS